MYTLYIVYNKHDPSYPIVLGVLVNCFRVYICALVCPIAEKLMSVEILEVEGSKKTEFMT